MFPREGVNDTPSRQKNVFFCTKRKQKKLSQWPDLVSTALTAGIDTTRLRGLGTLLNLRLAVILGLPKIIGYMYD